MNASRTTALVLLASTLTATMVRADETAKVKANLVGQYRQMVKEVIAKQSKPLMAHLTPDFTIKYMGQMMTRKQYERDIMEGLKNFADLKVKLDVTAFALKNNKATVKTRMTQSGKTTKPIQGLPPSFVLTMLTTDEWIKTPQGWKMKFSDAVLTAPTPPANSKVGIGTLKLGGKPKAN